MTEIEIGAAKLLALYFLQNDYDSEDREYLLENLCSLYSKHEVKIVKEFEEVVKEMESLAEQETLTETEDYRREYLEDWIAENAYKYRTEKNALAQAIIIVVSKYLDSKIQGAIGLYRFKKKVPTRKKKVQRDLYSKEYKKVSIGIKIYEIQKTKEDDFKALKYKLYDLGTMASAGISWARGVIAASNYIRHHQEWNYPEYQQIKVGEELMFKKNEYSLKDIDMYSKSTVESLSLLGFPIVDIIKSNADMSYKIVDKLELGSKVKTLKMIQEWLEAVENYIKADLAID